MRIFLLICMLFSLSLHAGETVIQSVPIPNRLFKQGEAQLIQPDEGPRFMRIALSTKHLTRVENKIIEGENIHWPESTDSDRYLAVLRNICTQAIENKEKTVVLTINWHPDRVSLEHQSQSCPVTDLSSDYMEQNLLLIIRDQFDLSSEDAKSMLKRDESP